MGLGFSRNIYGLRNSALRSIKKSIPLFYKLLILIGAVFKFLYNTNKKKKFETFSENLDEINEFEYKKTSQNNEDGIIEYLLQKLKLNNVNFVEIGFDYFQNNSLNIIKKTKKGLFVDGSGEKVFLLKYITKLFYPMKNIEVINAMIHKDNINEIISKKFDEEDEIDFLSIDIDGVDYYVFENLKFKPKIVCIEYNFWYGKEVKCSVPYSEEFEWNMESFYSGASLKALCSLANSKDYHLIALDSSCVNVFFVRGDLRYLFKVLDSEKSFKVPLRYTKDKINNEKNKLLNRPLVYF